MSSVQSGALGKQMLKVFMCRRICVWFLCDVHVCACVRDACVCMFFQPVMNFPAFTALVQSCV